MSDIRSFFRKSPRLSNAAAASSQSNTPSQRASAAPSSELTSTTNDPNSTPNRTGEATSHASSSSANPSSGSSSASGPRSNDGQRMSYLPNDIGSKENDPAQPKRSSYPENLQIENPRHTKTFKCAWYTRHRWIIYSISTDRVYCFCCIFFHTHSSGHQEETYYKTGFRQWNKAVGDRTKGLDKHALTKQHIDAEARWHAYLQRDVSVADRDTFFFDWHK